MPIIKRVPDFEDGKTFIVENVLVDHCSVFQPNTTYRPEWAVVIRVPQQLVQQFYEVGFRLKQNPDGVIHLRAKRWVRLDDGTEMKPPQVVDADGNPWDVAARGLIGNGSRCNVKVRAKYTTYQGVEGLGCFLEGLQVCDLVPYAGNGPGFGKAQGNTAGWSQQNFTAQPAQAAPVNPGFNPAAATPAGYNPAPQAGGFVPPTQAPVNPYAAAPPQQQFNQPIPQAPVNSAVPQHMQQAVPQQPMFPGQVAAPIAAAAAQTFFGQQTPAQQPSALGQVYNEEVVPDYNPAGPGAYTGTGSDVPF